MFVTSATVVRTGYHLKYVRLARSLTESSRKCPIGWRRRELCGRELSPDDVDFARLYHAAAACIAERPPFKKIEMSTRVDRPGPTYGRPKKWERKSR
jgi:hypothetical protein